MGPLILDDLPHIYFQETVGQQELCVLFHLLD